MRAEITPPSGETARVREAVVRLHPRAPRGRATPRSRHGQVLVDLPFGKRAQRSHLARGRRWRPLRGHRLGLGERRLRLRELRLDGVVVDAGEDLALLHPVADVRQHLGQALAADLRADDRLLPRGDVAVGRQHLRPLRRLQRNRRHRQRGAGLRLGVLAGRGFILRPARDEPDAGRGHDGRRHRRYRDLACSHQENAALQGIRRCCSGTALREPCSS